MRSYTRNTMRMVMKSYMRNTMRMGMKPYMRNMIIAVVLAVVKGLAYNLSVSNFQAEHFLIYEMGLGKPAFLPSHMVKLITDLFPIFIIEFIEGISIYKHMCSGGVYYFSRQSNRRRWFYKEVLQLALRVACYILTYFLAETLVVVGCFRGTLSLAAISLLVYLILYALTYAVLFALGINLLSVLAGSQIGLTIVYCIQLAFMAVLLLYDTEMKLKGIGLWIFRLNPIANVIFTWHSTQGTLKPYVNLYQINFDLNSSILYFAAGSVLLIFIGAMLVDRQDIALINREVEG